MNFLKSSRRMRLRIEKSKSLLQMQEVVMNLEKFSNTLQNRRYCENDVIFWKTMHYVCFITFYKDCDKRNIEVIKYSVNLNPKRILHYEIEKSLLATPKHIYFYGCECVIHIRCTHIAWALAFLFPSLLIGFQIIKSPSAAWSIPKHPFG